MRTQRIHPSLPIFLLQASDAIVVYTPGHASVLTGSEARLLERAFRSGLADIPSRIARLAEDVARLARQAKQSWEALSTAEFQPTCLTIYLSNACNLRCSYCFAADRDGARIRPGDGSLPVLTSAPALPRFDDARLLPAAELVAGNCQRLDKPFQLVLHGGGEPTLHWDLLQRVVRKTRETSHRFGVPWQAYIATHGAIGGKRAQWLAENFQHIGVSCDGPPEIHDWQRSSAGGAGTYAQVAETIRIVLASQAALTLRATITRRSVRRQAEIVAFFAESFGACDIRFEPMYHSDKAGELSFAPEDASEFANHFLAVQGVADALGCRLTLSGVRLDEIHGPYCNVLRDVLQLTPDGTASACFLVTDARAGGGAELAIGGAASATADFRVEVERVRRMRARAAAIPARCEECVNVYHCARDCPDACPVVDPVGHLTASPGFRCLIQKELGQRWISELAWQHGDHFWQDEPSAERVAQSKQLSRVLRLLPADVDPEPIVKQWRFAVSFDRLEARGLPEPPWSTNGFTEDGGRAWDCVSQALDRSGDYAPMSCYVHMPYCDRKCGFCDCYARQILPDDLGKHAAYVDALIHEIHCWAGFDALRRRPLTTVHFGGGTPSYVPPRHFQRFLREFRARFTASADTEWALETTTSQLSGDYLEQLREWGFSRLHVGVQSLNDRIRTIVGRRENAATVLGKLSLALERGFIVSADLIYGLPTQALEDFIGDITAVTRLGIDGCSLYHLNRSPRNRAFLDLHREELRSALESYLFFQAGEAILAARGYVKNHFAHFARHRDKNLYYTHVARGEDLLALGTTADGSFDGYCYRHPPLSEYLAGASARRVALEGGLNENAGERRMKPVTAALMAGHARMDAFAQSGAMPLLERWIRYGMLEPGAEKDAFRLTANGSWFISRLLAELQAYAIASAEPPMAT